MAITYSDPDVDTDANTVQIAALTPTDNAVIIGNGSAWVAESGATLKTSLGLTIGTDVQAYSANLTSWAAVTPASYLTTAAAAAAYQPLDSDLTSWAGVTRASGFDTFAATPTSANLRALITDETGSGSLVFATSPTLVTPALGVATATSVNGLTITTTTGTITITNAKTLSVSNTLTLTATDGSTLAIGTGGTLASAAYVATGTSGATIPLCNGAITWSGIHNHTATAAQSDAKIGVRNPGNCIEWGHSTTAYSSLLGAEAGTGSPYIAFNAEGGTNSNTYRTRGNKGFVLRSTNDGGATFNRVDTASADNQSLTNVATIYTTGGWAIGSPTGGDKGAGTLNATAVYDDNTLLTCYVLDAALDGRIDMAKWDEKVPNREIPAEGEQPASVEVRIHEDARKFEARLGGKYDPLDIDKYAAHWKEKRHLTSMPNEATFDPEKGMAIGSWVQRLIETVEIQAVHIDNLNQRLKAAGL